MFRTKDTYGKHRYSGRSKAQVIDNRDPANKGRIQVKHPILGETVWIDYLRQPNQFDVPSIGDVVYVECDTGEHEFPIAHGNLTLGYPGQALLPDVFKRNVPTNRGLFTPGGHLIEMDDGESNPTKSPTDKDLTSRNRGVRITSKAGNKVHIMEDVAQGAEYILLEGKNGTFIKIDNTNNNIEVYTKNNHNTVVDNNTRLIVSGNVTIECANATISATGNAIVTAGQIQLNGTAGNILTTETDQVVDTIFGIPTVGVPTVKSG